MSQLYCIRAPILRSVSPSTRVSTPCFFLVCLIVAATFSGLSAQTSPYRGSLDVLVIDSASQQKVERFHCTVYADEILLLKDKLSWDGKIRVPFFQAEQIQIKVKADGFHEELKQFSFSEGEFEEPVIKLEAKANREKLGIARIRVLDQAGGPLENCDIELHRAKAVSNQRGEAYFFPKQHRSDFQKIRIFKGSKLLFSDLSEGKRVGPYTIEFRIKQDVKLLVELPPELKHKEALDLVLLGEGGHIISKTEIPVGRNSLELMAEPKWVLPALVGGNTFLTAPPMLLEEGKDARLRFELQEYSLSVNLHADNLPEGEKALPIKFKLLGFDSLKGLLPNQFFAYEHTAFVNQALELKLPVAACYEVQLGATHKKVWTSSKASSVTIRYSEAVSKTFVYEHAGKGVRKDPAAAVSFLSSFESKSKFALSSQKGQIQHRPALGLPVDFVVTQGMLANFGWPGELYSAKAAASLSAPSLRYLSLNIRHPKDGSIEEYLIYARAQGGRVYAIAKSSQAQIQLWVPHGMGDLFVYARSKPLANTSNSQENLFGSVHLNWSKALSGGASSPIELAAEVELEAAYPITIRSHLAFSELLVSSPKFGKLKFSQPEDVKHIDLFLPAGDYKLGGLGSYLHSQTELSVKPEANQRQSAVLRSFSKPQPVLNRSFHRSSRMAASEWSCRFDSREVHASEGVRWVKPIVDSGFLKFHFNEIPLDRSVRLQSLVPGWTELYLFEGDIEVYRDQQYLPPFQKFSQKVSFRAKTKNIQGQFKIFANALDSKARAVPFTRIGSWYADAQGLSAIPALEAVGAHEVYIGERLNQTFWISSSAAFSSGPTSPITLFAGVDSAIALDKQLLGSKAGLRDPAVVYDDPTKSLLILRLKDLSLEQSRHLRVSLNSIPERMLKNGQAFASAAIPEQSSDGTDQLYSFRNLESCQHLLQIFWDSNLVHTTLLNLKPGFQKLTISFEDLDVFMSLNPQVQVTSAGKALTGATMRVKFEGEDWQEGKELNTGQGIYEYKMKAPGVASIELNYPGWPPIVFQEKLEKENRLHCKIPSASLKLIVVDPSGKRISGASGKLMWGDQQELAFTVDDQGEYTAERLFYGAYSVLLDLPQLMFSPIEFDISGDRELSIEAYRGHATSLSLRAASAYDQIRVSICSHSQKAPIGNINPRLSEFELALPEAREAWLVRGLGKKYVLRPISLTRLLKMKQLNWLSYGYLVVDVRSKEGVVPSQASLEVLSTSGKALPSWWNQYFPREKQGWSRALPVGEYRVIVRDQGRSAEKIVRVGVGSRSIVQLSY